MNNKQSYPLCWPDGWKRTSLAQRVNGRFSRKETKYRHTSPNTQDRYTVTNPVTTADSVKRLLQQLDMMCVNTSSVVVSTNVEPKLDGMPRSGKEPSDPGAAVYWMDGNQQRCMAIDRYTNVADNLAAIAATLEAMRAIERHGGAEILNRAFLGFAALPEQASGSWRYHLGFGETEQVNLEKIESAYRDLVKKHHPDYGGNADTFRQITEARHNAKRELFG